MKLVVGKRIYEYISFGKVNVLNIKFFYKTGILCRDWIIDLGPSLDPQVYFHQNIDYLFSHSLKLLNLTRITTYPFSSLYCRCRFTIA
jgi:hypothetical protein